MARMTTGAQARQAPVPSGQRRPVGSCRSVLRLRQPQSVTGWRHPCASVSAPIEPLAHILSAGGLAGGSCGDEQVKSLLAHVLVLRLREHSQHSCRSDRGARVRALPLVPLEGGGNGPAWMNDNDSRMTAAEQHDAEGVVSFGAGNPEAIRAPCSSWDAHDSLAAATAGARACGGLEAVTAAWTSNRRHVSSMELVGASKRAICSAPPKLSDLKV
jgi:hypothetical protein